MKCINSDISSSNQTNRVNNKFSMFILDKLAQTYENAGKDVIKLTLGKSDLQPHINNILL